MLSKARQLRPRTTCTLFTFREVVALCPNSGRYSRTCISSNALVDFEIRSLGPKIVRYSTEESIQHGSDGERIPSRDNNRNLASLTILTDRAHCIKISPLVHSHDSQKDLPGTHWELDSLNDLSRCHCSTVQPSDWNCLAARINCCSASRRLDYSAVHLWKRHGN